MKLALAGDTMLGRGVAERLASGSPESLFAPEVVAAVGEADLCLLNLECCISERGAPVSGKVFHFRAPVARKRSPTWASTASRDAERARRTSAKRAEEKRMKRLLGPDYRNPERAPEHRPASRSERGERRDPLPQSSTARLGVGGVPLFPNTLEGRYERLAYYEARKLNHLPHSLLDYHDVIRGREPAERRARVGRASSRRR